MQSSSPATLLLNGFHLSLSKDTFAANVLGLPDNTQFKDLRKEHQDWLLSWRDGTLYAIPKIANPRTNIGTTQRLPCSEHLPLLVAAIDGILPGQFPSYKTFNRRPFAFLGKRAELVGTISKRLRNPPALLSSFTIRPAFTLQAKIIEPSPQKTSIGLFLTINTKWEISADIDQLKKAGIDLNGLYVVRRNPLPDERRLIGQIRTVEGTTIHLAAAYDDRPTITTSEASLEGSKTSFARCLKTLLGRDYEYFEQSRQREEAKLLNGPAINDLFGQFHQFFQKNPTLQLTADLSVTINEQLRIADTNDYQTIHQAPPVQYYFNPARTKASPYPWMGIKQYGPFSKDTFPKRTPNILVVFPDAAQGSTEQFLNSLRDGVTVTGRPQYEGGFAKLFGLLNPPSRGSKCPP